jgi:hypothetical protein
MTKKATQNSKIVDAIGMPDEWDKRNIQRLINNFEQRYPGLNAQSVAAARWEYDNVVDRLKVGDFNVKSKQLEMRHLVTMHPQFAKELEVSYPGIFRFKEHTIWFAKNFEKFRVAKRI